uniref:Uncharacterized protein n=1 Tax=Heterorhabditis bacteriophora TaxID=37862 RepID=A0A1I7WZP0_HETBA
MGVRFVSTTRLPQPYGSCTTQQKEFTKQYNGTYENQQIIGQIII